MDEELYRWRMKWLAVPIDKRPQTLTESLKSVCHSGLPNISMLLKLFATIPLSSCSCERSASALRRLNTYMRSTQTEERISGLALIHCKYETDIDVDEACKLFFKKHPRRMECGNIIYD